MYIETTTCISLEHCAILKRYSQLHGISIRTLISSLIHYAILTEKRKAQPFKRVEYRERNQDWKRFHLYLFEDEYEFFIDVKKVWKMSLANVIAYCIDTVLPELLKLLTKEDDTDNYRYRNYSFGFFKEEGIQCCKFYWGLHPEIIRKASP